MKPLVFVAMPFGRKKVGKFQVDFDRIYDLMIKPSEDQKEFDFIRADEERMGGFIHKPMFERLIIADIVIADLTGANPNVFYELGIRHAAKPKTTILLYAENTGTLPFDVRGLRAIPYRLDDNGYLTDEQALPVKKVIEQRLQDARHADLGPDSPIFQFFKDAVGTTLPLEDADTMREHLMQVYQWRMGLKKAKLHDEKEEALAAIQAIEQQLWPFQNAELSLLVDLQHAYRDISEWDQMIRVTREFPNEIQRLLPVQEQLSLALNKRNAPGDRKEAKNILQDLIDKHGVSPETCGLLGSVYKNLFLEFAAIPSRAGEAQGYLEAAITQYVSGFEEDIRDYYPGINALTLLFVSGQVQEFDRLLPLVKYALQRHQKNGKEDYFFVATALELAILEQNWELARKLKAKLYQFADLGWHVKTTVQNFTLILREMERRQLPFSELTQIVQEFEQHVQHTNAQ